MTFTMAVATIKPANVPALDRAVGWIDAPVLDVLGRNVGRVRAVLCDAEGRPWWLVLRRRGLRGRTVLAPFDATQPTEDGPQLACSAESLDAAPDPGGDDPTAEGLRQLARYWGVFDDERRTERHRGDCRHRRRSPRR